MKNKTATECWTILRSELDSAIDRYVPMKKQGKGLRRNICQKRLSERLGINKLCGGFINIREMIQIKNYKQALNEATHDVGKSKRNLEHKLARNIKSDIKSFYAYVRSKQNVRDKVGPLETMLGI